MIKFGFLESNRRHRLTPIGRRARRCRRLAAVLLPLLLLWDLAAALELNSERIERIFGSYGIRVLEQQQQHRVSSLYSNALSGPVCRTLATVRYADVLPPALQGPHKAITAGASIGATLKRSGWEVHKINRHLGSIAASGDASRISRLMKIALPESLALHVYDLDVRRGEEQHRYATIVEVHHPDYLDIRELKSIYRDLPQAPLSAGELETLQAWVTEKMRMPR